MPPHDTAGGGRRKRPFPAAFCSHKPLFFQKGTCYTQIKWMRLPHREAAAEKNEVFCMIIQNALVYTPRHTFARGTLFIRNGRIVPFAAPEAGEEVIDAEGLYALPGLVDIHFHGAMGKDFCDGTEEAIQTLADFEASKGVLAICPATMTYPEEFLNHVMDAAAAHKNGKGADLVGINMEGPFISPKKVGAQNPEYVQGADAGMFRRLQKRAGGLIKLVDVAPEEPGNLDFIKECHNEVRISIAHTCTDNVHIHPAMVRFTFNTFGADHVCLIADSMMACGLPDGQYSLGGQAVTVKGPLATLTEQPGTIAGSNTCLYDCMKRAVLEMNVPLESAVRAASENPARSIGVDNDYGSLAAGRYGNVILADKELNIKAVIQKGTRIV